MILKKYLEFYGNTEENGKIEIIRASIIRLAEALFFYEVTLTHTKHENKPRI
jgi:hypothetical protein